VVFQNMKALDYVSDARIKKLCQNALNYFGGWGHWIGCTFW
jgi:hypothetical protein